MLVIVLISVVCTVTSVRHSGNRVTIELEDSADLNEHQDRIMWRGRGSMKRTLLLYEEEYVDIAFCLSALTKVTVTNIRYSNDGLADHIVLLMDNQTVADFETVHKTNWGHMWNVFSETGPVTSPMLLSPGYHSLRVWVHLSDNYGTELDSLQLQLENQPSYQIFFCTKAMTEHVTFSQLPIPKIDRDKTDIVRLSPNIEPFQCIGKYNVFMCLETKYFIGMQISAESEYLNNTGLGLKWEDKFEATSKCSIKNITLWSVGWADNSNADLGDAGTGFLEFNADTLTGNPRGMAGLVVNPTSSSIYIKYSIPLRYEREAVSGIFTLGIVDPQMLLVSIQYFQHESLTWSNIDHRLFYSTSRIHHWSIPRDAFSHDTHNTIRILFSGSPLPVRIDFLQLDLQSVDPIISTLDLFHDSHLVVYGIRHSSSANTKMLLSSAHAPNNKLAVDQMSVMARKGRRAEYHKVITLHSDGRLMLYTLAELRPLLEEYPESVSEPSGVFISPNFGVMPTYPPVSISNVEINDDTNSINIVYSDRSHLMFKFTIVADSTRFVLYDVKFATPYPFHFCYFSKLLQEDLKAVSKVDVDDDTSVEVSETFPLALTGKKFYFDHEEASWFVQAGSDIMVQFP